MSDAASTDREGSAPRTVSAAMARLAPLVGCRFGTLLDPLTLAAMTVNKGGTGRSVERLIGMKAGASGRDFVDGELKTYRSDADGFPNESVAVLQFGPRFDEYLSCPPFATTSLHRRLSRLLMVGVFKDGPPADWRIQTVFRVESEPGTEWFARLDSSYRSILRELLERVRAGTLISTISAQHLQIRVHDARPYRPVESARLGRRVASKQLGFYLMRSAVAEMVDEVLSAGRG